MIEAGAGVFSRECRRYDQLLLSVGSGLLSEERLLRLMPLELTFRVQQECVSS